MRLRRGISPTRWTILIDSCGAGDVPDVRFLASISRKVAMPQYKFPTVEEIIDVNRRVLAEIPVKKADRHQGLVTKEIATNS